MISTILKFLVNTLKITAFVLAVLVASHLVRWNGKTISDQVKTTLSSEEPKAWMKQAEKRSRNVAAAVKEKAASAEESVGGKLTDQIKEVVARTPEQARAWIQAQKESADSSMNPRSNEDTISENEKNELSSLIEN